MKTVKGHANGARPPAAAKSQAKAGGAGNGAKPAGAKPAGAKPAGAKPAGAKSAKTAARDTIALLREVSTATLTMQLLKRGFRNLAITGVRAMNPAAGRFVGPAFTLRFIPGREDICQPPKPGEPENAQRHAIENTPAGHVLVVATGGQRSTGTLGDILAMRLKARGVAGVVSDGAMRDTPVMETLDFPIFALGAAAPASMTTLYAVETQTPVGVCGVPVFPGDILVADGDGVVVIPRHLADEVARDGWEQERVERYVQLQVRKGRAIPGLYPPDESTRAAYRAWLEAGEPDR